MTAIPPGEWVQASDSLEFDLCKRGAVGYYHGRLYGAEAGYAVGPELEGKIWGAYRHIRRITKAEGREVIRGWREARQERWYAHAPLGEQIRTFLRHEAAKRRFATCNPTLICPTEGESDCSEAPAANMLAT